MLVTDIPVERLVPYARNPRNNAKAIDAVKASIAVRAGMGRNSGRD